MTYTWIIALRFLREARLQTALIIGGAALGVAVMVFLTELIPPGSTWTVTGVGRAQLSMAGHAILMGGHVRVGLEDNIWYSKGRLASNAELRAVEESAAAADNGPVVQAPCEADAGSEVVPVSVGVVPG